jgi:DNA primase
MIWSYKQVILYFGLINRHLWVILQIIRQLEKSQKHLSRENQPSFYRSDVRSWMRINPNNLKYYLAQLQQYGHLKVIGGNKYKQGYEYEVSDLEEYEKLNGTLLNALEEALIKIKAQS